MAKQWRCAVVGTGVVGEWHVKVTSQLPNTRLVAVCDIDGAAKNVFGVECNRPTNYQLGTVLERRNAGDCFVIQLIHELVVVGI